MADPHTPARGAENTLAQDIAIVRRYLRSMAQQISGSYISEGPALAHRALDRIAALASHRKSSPSDDLCDHGCGDEATVQHADGRMLCYPCYRTETGGDNQRLAGCPTCSPVVSRLAAVSSVPAEKEQGDG